SRVWAIAADGRCTGSRPTVTDTHRKRVDPTAARGRFALDSAPARCRGSNKERHAARAPRARSSGRVEKYRPLVCEHSFVATRRCVFDGRRPLTVEHAIPDWVRAYLPGEGDLTSTRGEREWRTKALSITVDRVCADCNSGWMSRLEDRAKPLLADPIQSRRRRWTPREQRTVATWAYKTALMGGLATGHSHVPEAHFRHLRRNLHPPGRVFIWTTVDGLQPGATRFQVADVQSRGFTLESTHG